MNDGSQPAGSQAQARDRLDSWKEIAAYLKRDQRTVRRWEQEKGLPVHRVGRNKGASVYAYPAELEAWLDRQDEAAAPPTPAPAGPAVPATRPWLAVSAALIVVAMAAGWALWRHRPKPTAAGPVAPASAAIRSLVVLPLNNLSGSGRQDYFAAALSDELTTDLAQLPGLQVVSRTSAVAVQAAHANMAAIRRQLHVDGVVEGSVVRADHRVRVNVQLIRAASDAHIWARSFESGENDVLRMQDDIANAIAAEIKATLGAANPAQARLAPSLAVKPAAYDDYLHGLYWMGLRDNDSLNKSVAAFARATREDPSFAAGWTGLAEANCLLADYQLFGTEDVQATAQRAVQRALRLDPRSDSAHAVLGYIAWRFEWNWPRADAEFRQALALNPNASITHEWYALFLSSQEKPGAAEAEMEAAVRLDPLSRIMQINLGLVPYYSGNLALAQRRFRAALQLDSDFAPAATKLWLTDANLGHGQAALADLLEVNRILSGPVAERTRLQAAFQSAGVPGLANRELVSYRALCGPGYCSPYATAMMLALGGQNSAALSTLNTALRQHDAWLPYLAVEPAFHGLRADSRFHALLASVGLRTVN